MTTSCWRPWPPASQGLAADHARTDSTRPCCSPWAPPAPCLCLQASGASFGAQLGAAIRAAAGIFLSPPLCLPDRADAALLQALESTQPATTRPLLLLGPLSLTQMPHRPSLGRASCTPAAFSQKGQLPLRPFPHGPSQRGCSQPPQRSRHATLQARSCTHTTKSSSLFPRLQPLADRPLRQLPGCAHCPQKVADISPDPCSLSTSLLACTHCAGPLQACFAPHHPAPLPCPPTPSLPHSSMHQPLPSGAPTLGLSSPAWPPA